MSRYTVVSQSDAENELATIWANAVDRRQVSEAADRADRLLAEDPLKDSVHLGEQLWRRDIPPLRFYFEVREQDRLVVVSWIVQRSR
jgi:hypothetical protein